MLMKKPEHKKFEYIPRYYNPDKDKEQNLKDKFEIARHSHLLKRKNNKLFIYFVLITIIIYLAIRFGLI